MAHERQQVQRKLVKSGQAPATGEDYDLERKCEALPFSDLLLAHASTYAQLFDPSVQQALMSKLDALRKRAEALFKSEGIDSQAGPLDTEHEAVLASVSALLHGQYDSLIGKAPRKRFSAKASAVPAEHMHELLVTFAITAFLELSEKWSRVPCEPQHSEFYREATTRSVCNMDAREFRSYGRLVYDERAANATPLVTHLCDVWLSAAKPAPGQAIYQRCR